MGKPPVRLRKIVTRPIASLLRQMGYQISGYRPPREYPKDFTADEIADYLVVRDFTLTSPERVVSLCRAVEYIVRNDIAGAMVECGVWKGGSMMAVARVLLRLGASQRPLYLFDTYEGMSRPSAVDVNAHGESAEALWQRNRVSDQTNEYCYASLAEVEKALWSTGYPKASLHFVKGPVEETVPKEAPDCIALLRLDTDWYESTRHELNHLYPRLSRGGVLIVDDYDCWQGSRKATDEYLRLNNIALLLTRIDGDARLGVKPN